MKLYPICYLLILFFGIFMSPAPAQITGGNNVFGFLDLSPSARVTALGGNLITVRDDDVNLAFANPSLLNPAMHGQITFNHSFLPAGIGHGYAAYGHFLPKWNSTLHSGIQYINYGDFDLTDETGIVHGSFKASEYAFALGIGRELYERLSVGANLKFIDSRFESYQSTGVTADIAAVFHDTANYLNITLLAKNIGAQLGTYNGQHEPVPFEMQAGISKQLRYLPFRFSIIYRYLDRWNILYDDPNAEEDTFFFGGDQTANSNDMLDNLARHFIFNGEFLFGKKDNFRLRFGYNHLRRKEMTVKNLRSLAGFSMGVGLKINRFRVEYGRSSYHLGAGVNHFSISTNLQEFTKNGL